MKNNEYKKKNRQTTIRIIRENNALRNLAHKRFIYTNLQGGENKKILHKIQMLCSSPNLKTSFFTLDEKNGRTKQT